MSLRVCVNTRLFFISPRCCCKRRLNRSEEHTSELQSRQYLVCRLLLEKKTKGITIPPLFLKLTGGLRDSAAHVPMHQSHRITLPRLDRSACVDGDLLGPEIHPLFAVHS